MIKSAILLTNEWKDLQAVLGEPIDLASPSSSLNRNIKISDLNPRTRAESFIETVNVRAYTKNGIFRKKSDVNNEWFYQLSNYAEIHEVFIATEGWICLKNNIVFEITRQDSATFPVVKNSSEVEHSLYRGTCRQLGIQVEKHFTNYWIIV